MNQENTKRCPQCAEVIKAGAVKCRYCGSDCRSDKMTAEKPQPAAVKRKSPWKLGCLIVVGVFALLLILFMLGGGLALDGSSLEDFKESCTEVRQYIIENYREEVDMLSSKKARGILSYAETKRLETLERTIKMLDVLTLVADENDLKKMDGMTPEEVIEYYAQWN